MIEHIMQNEIVSKPFYVKLFFVCVQQLIAVKIEIPSMTVKLKLIYEKASIAVNSKAHGYVKPELSKVLDMTVRSPSRTSHFFLTREGGGGFWQGSHFFWGQREDRSASLMRVYKMGAI